MQSLSCPRRVGSGGNEQAVHAGSALVNCFVGRVVSHVNDQARAKESRAEGKGHCVAKVANVCTVRRAMGTM